MTDDDTPASLQSRYENLREAAIKVIAAFYGLHEYLVGEGVDKFLDAMYELEKQVKS